MGIGYATWVALALFLLASVGFSLGLFYMSDPNMHTEDKFKMAQLGVSILSIAGGIVAFVLALLQYRKSEQWKRFEFIASELKDLESDPAVQNALLMIDWGTREINLFLRPDPCDNDLIEITRDIQWKALLPHTLKKKYPEYKASDTSSDEAVGKGASERRFTPIEARIRDSYDTFLTKLDRLYSFIDSKLISAEELDPFIRYWVDAITKNEHPEADTIWRCILLTYVDFYGYTGVQSLLKCYGRNVDPAGPIYSLLRGTMQDRVLAERLLEVI